MIETSEQRVARVKREIRSGTYLNPKIDATTELILPIVLDDDPLGTTELERLCSTDEEGT